MERHRLTEKTLAVFVATAALLFLGFVVCVIESSPAIPQDAPIPFISVPEYIAHAGGGIGKMCYTNSREALDANFLRGHRFFELDLNWTNDDQLVLIHDWNHNYEDLFRQPGHADVPSLDTFLQLRMKNNLTPLSFAELADWLRDHPEARIVTDVKDDSLRALRRISTEFPELVQRIIPQIYAFEEYRAVWDMGYRNILLTLYVKGYPAEAVLEFAQGHRLFGVTMSAKLAMGPLPKQLQSMSVPVFAHTVNSSEEERKLKANGVSGVYTDFLCGK